MSNSHPSALPVGIVELANRLADNARPIVRQYFRTRPEIDSKQDQSPVTIADRKIELMMRELITEAFPDHGIRGEEFDAHQPLADWCWHLDPIDGTKSFLSGSLCFGTQVALTYRGTPMLGLIDQPITEERWFSQKNVPTTFNGRPVETSACTRLDQAILYTSDLVLFDESRREKFDRLRHETVLTRYSHDCYAAGLLAMGQTDLLIETGVHAYDIAAQIPIIEEAGGVVSDWFGSMPQLDRQVDFLAAATPALHAQALAILTA